MIDYKYEIQMIAEEIAEEKYGVDYYNLEETAQNMIYRKAEETWSENKYAEAEQMSDRLKGF